MFNFKMLIKCEQVIDFFFFLQKFYYIYVVCKADILCI
jgi:hypothetical protein